MVTTRSATGSLPKPRLNSLRDVEDEMEEERQQLHEALFKPLKRWRETGEPPADYVEERPEWLHDSVLSSFSSRIDQAVCCQKSKDRPNNVNEQQVLRRQKRWNTRNDGRLSLLFTMPLDIICEVTSYLSPLDVLHLARSGRIIRNFLMSKSSKPVWRASRKFINLPDCPHDMSEPQYASLVLETECNVCGAPNIQRVDYTLRVRLCRGCFRENVVRGSDLVKELPKAYSRDWLMFILVPFHDFWLGSDYNHRFASVDYLQQRYFKPDFMDIAKKYIHLSGNPDRQAHFVVQRVKANIHAAIHAKALRSWFREIEELKHREDGVRSKARQIQILSRLEELGFTPDQYPRERDSLTNRWIMLLTVPHEITTRNWKTIRPQLEAMIKNTQNERIERARKARLHLRQKELRSFYITYLVDLETNRTERQKYWWLKPDTGPREETTQGERKWNEQKRLERLTLPNFGDLKSIPLVKHLIEEEDGYMIFTSTKWEAVREILPDEATKLFQRMLDNYEIAVEDTRKELERTRVSDSRRCKNDCLTVVVSKSWKGKGKAEPIPDCNDDDDEFPIVPAALRASSFFTCRRQTICRQANTPFPEILGGRHFCGISGEQAVDAWLHFLDDGLDADTHDNDNVVVEPQWASWLRYKPRCSPWKEGTLDCSMQAMEISEALLKELGLTSARTSMADLMELGKVFECGRCFGGETMTWVELVGHYFTELSWNQRAQEKLTKYKVRLSTDVLKRLPPAPKVVNDHAILCLYAPPLVNKTSSIALKPMVRVVPDPTGSSSHTKGITISSDVRTQTTPSSQTLLNALLKAKDKLGTYIGPSGPGLMPKLVTPDYTIEDDAVSDTEVEMNDVSVKQETELEKIGDNTFPPYEPEFLRTITTINVRCALCERLCIVTPFETGKGLGRHIYSKHAKIPELSDIIHQMF